MIMDYGRIKQSVWKANKEWLSSRKTDTIENNNIFKHNRKQARLHFQNKIVGDLQINVFLL